MCVLLYVHVVRVQRKEDEIREGEMSSWHVMCNIMTQHRHCFKRLTIVVQAPEILTD